MQRILVGALAALGAALVLAASASAAATTAPYSGENPFRCKLQNVGTGVDFPDPNADPFCVEFDKTSQNLTDFGIVDFLLNEPARVAAAAPKCFYHQTDHWTGWIVQGVQELWHWDGKYFFDKAAGRGGVHIENFRVNGQTSDPRTLPGFPPEYYPYFYPGGGGVYVDSIASEPDCAAKVDTNSEQAKIYKPGWRYPN